MAKIKLAEMVLNESKIKIVGKVGDNVILKGMDDIDIYKLIDICKEQKMKWEFKDRDKRTISVRIYDLLEYFLKNCDLKY